MLSFSGDGLWTYVSGSLSNDGNISDILTIVENPGKTNESKSYFYDTEKRRFLSGLLSIVEKGLIFDEIDFQFTNPKSAGEKITIDPNVLDNITLREYQVAAVEKMFIHAAGIVRVPTAGGKTVIGGAFLKTLDVPSIFFVGSTPLVHQVAQKFQHYGLKDVGVIGDGEFRPGFVTVVDIRWFSQLMKQAAYSSKIKKFIKSIQAVIYDETHHLAANSWTRVALAFDVKYRFGFSGTPFKVRERTSYRDYFLHGVCGDLIYELPATYLIEKGYIAEPNIYFLNVMGPQVEVKYNSRMGMGAKGKAYQRIYQLGIVEHSTRNDLALSLAEMLVSVHNLNTLVLVKHLDHGQNLLAEMVKRGIPAVFIAGSGKVFQVDENGDVVQTVDEIVDYQSQTVRAYLDGKYRVLIASPVLGEGYDLPDSAVEALIILTGEKSLIPVLQRLGRALRPKPGDNKVFVFDFNDNQHFFFKHHSDSRRKEYEKEGYKVYDWTKFIQDFLGETNGIKAS